ncbi:MAG TPA: site-2 protease family protein [archaeon]|nr:site-2 protease family protein [archaeon]
MDLNHYFSSTGQELESFLNVFYKSHRMFDLPRERVIRGVVEPRFARMRNMIEHSLKSFPGRYSFEQVGDDTYLTISTSLGVRPRQNWKLHAGLFLVTILTTLLVGSLREGGDPFFKASELALGVPFSAAIMLILLVHELGHYFAARYHGMDVTLPFFIPLPPPFIFGTGGALIKMRSPMFSRRMLLDVGAAGPIAGFLVSVPIVILGLMSSSWSPVPPQYFVTGNSLLFSWLTHLALGPAPQGYYLEMSSVAFAGWIGFFVTAMNLLPIGQLDGGHIGYALIGRRHTRMAYTFFVLMLVLGLFWPGWIFWALLILFLIRVKHPPIIDEEIPLDSRRKAVGVATFCILVLTFMPMPILA